MPIWNTLDVPLDTGWQCTLIPAPQYAALMQWGCRDMSARRLYPHAGRERWPPPWSASEPDEKEKHRKWKDDVQRQLADDRRAFARHFRPDWDLRTATGENALHTVHTFLRDALGTAHWNQPTDNAGVRQMLCEAVANKRLIPVVNREYRGQPRVARPDPAPLKWPAPTSAGVATAPEIISYIDFVALQRANGELGDSARLVDQASDDSTALGNAQPFDYQPEVPSDNTFDIAARDVGMSGNPPGTFRLNPNGLDTDYFDGNGNLSAQYHESHGAPHGHNVFDGKRDDIHLPMSPVNFY